MSPDTWRGTRVHQGLKRGTRRPADQPRSPGVGTKPGRRLHPAGSATNSRRCPSSQGLRAAARRRRAGPKPTVQGQERRRSRASLWAHGSGLRSEGLPCTRGQTRRRPGAEMLPVPPGTLGQVLALPARCEQGDTCHSSALVTSILKMLE